MAADPLDAFLWVFRHTQETAHPDSHDTDADIATGAQMWPMGPNHS